MPDTWLTNSVGICWIYILGRERSHKTFETCHHIIVNFWNKFCGRQTILVTDGHKGNGQKECLMRASWNPFITTRTLSFRVQRSCIIVLHCNAVHWGNFQLWCWRHGDAPQHINTWKHIWIQCNLMYCLNAFSHVEGVLPLCSCQSWHRLNSDAIK